MQRALIFFNNLPDLCARPFYGFRDLLPYHEASPVDIAQAGLYLCIFICQIIHKTFYIYI